MGQRGTRGRGSPRRGARDRSRRQRRRRARGGRGGRGHLRPHQHGRSPPSARTRSRGDGRARRGVTDARGAARVARRDGRRVRDVSNAGMARAVALSIGSDRRGVTDLAPGLSVLRRSSTAHGPASPREPVSTMSSGLANASGRSSAVTKWPATAIGRCKARPPRVRPTACSAVRCSARWTLPARSHEAIRYSTQFHFLVSAV